MSLDFLDDDDWEPASGEHPTWSMEEIGNHPLFMDSLPVEHSNAHIDALQSVLYDEETPYGLCHNFKVQGNDALSRGFLDDAIVFYQNASSSGCEDSALLSQVHSNLALVYLKKKDYPKSTDECFRAIGLDPSNVEAYYRGSLASFKLELYSQAMYFVRGGIDVDPANQDLLKLLEDIEAAKRSQELKKQQIQNLSAESTQPRPKYRWRS
jgi:tetratricopeptide (TPR) repeat protein